MTIGPNAKIYAGAIIETGALVAAGAVVQEGTIVPAGEVWVGSPAHKLRNIEAQERENLFEQHEEAIKLSVVHNEENSKSFR